MPTKGTIRIKENNKIVEYYPQTTYDSVIDEAGSNLKTDMADMKSFKETAGNKLNGIAANATKTEKSATNGNIKINGAETVVYTHPSAAGSKHIPSGGVTGQILRWSAAGTAVWGADQDTTYSIATTTANGLMSKEDKVKLNGVATGANNYVHPNDANTRHVTDTEKSTWNAKETTTGSQTKATKALTDAKAYTDTKVAGIVNTAPEALDTLKELAGALGNDPNFSTTVMTEIGKKVDKVTGKGLSTNDYTTAEKTKLAGIATGANKTILNNTVTSTSTTEAATANAVKTAYDKANHSHPYAPTSHGNHVPTTQTANNAVFLRNDNTWQTINPDSIGASRGARVSASTAAVAGWYRIAQSAVSISNVIGEFQIRAMVSGKHSSTKLTAGITYGQSPVIQQMAHTSYSAPGISKARIVYHATYDGNYAYLEVYNPDATARTIEVLMFGNLGWSLVAPSTAGSIPSGYSNKEITLVAGRIVADINGTVNGYSIAKSVPSNAVFTDTVYNHPNDANTRHVTDTEKSTWNAKASTAVATTSANGLMTAAMVTKLNGIATSANNYVHPTTSGNKHIPSGGASGQILRWSADGTATWGADSNTTYGVVSKTANGLAPQLPNETTTTKYLRQDGTWAVPPNSTYTHPTGNGNNHIPSNGAANQFLKYSAAGTAVWSALPTGSTTASGMLQLNDATNSTSTTTAATANAVKKVMDAVSGKAPTTHTHTKAQISDFPASLPANGGNADSIGGLTPGSFMRNLWTLDLATVNDANYPVPYVGTLGNGDCASIGLNNDWHQVIYTKHAHNNGFGNQIFIRIRDARMFVRGSDGTSWGALRETLDLGNVSDHHIRIPKYQGVTSTNFNDIIKAGTYIIANSPALPNQPPMEYGFLEVIPVGAGDGGYVKQVATNVIHGNTYVRTRTENGWTNGGGWTELLDSTSRNNIAGYRRFHQGLNVAADGLFSETRGTLFTSTSNGELNHHNGSRFYEVLTAGNQYKHIGGAYTNRYFLNQLTNAEILNHGYNWSMDASSSQGPWGWSQIIQHNGGHFWTQMALSCANGTKNDVRMKMRTRYSGTGNNWSDWEGFQREIKYSTAAPTNDVGINGDVWIQY